MVGFIGLGKVLSFFLFVPSFLVGRPIIGVLTNIAGNRLGAGFLLAGQLVSGCHKHCGKWVEVGFGTFLLVLGGFHRFFICSIDFHLFSVFNQFSGSLLVFFSTGLFYLFFLFSLLCLF